MRTAGARVCGGSRGQAEGEGRHGAKGHPPSTSRARQGTDEASRRAQDQDEGARRSDSDARGSRSTARGRGARRRGCAGRAGVQRHPQGSELHPQADQDLRTACDQPRENRVGPLRGPARPRTRPDPGHRSGRRAPLGSAHRRRLLQQPAPGQGVLRHRREGLPDAGAPAEEVGRVRRPGRTRASPERTDQLPADLRLRDRQPAARDQQPDRRPDGDQPGGGRGGRRWRRGRPDHRDALHPERRPRRRPLRALQLMVHPVRPVLRPRPGPDRQGRARHRDHAPQARRSPVRGGEQHELHGAHPGDDRRQRQAHQLHVLLRRPEPDLRLAPLAPGVPARVRQRRGRQAAVDRWPDHRARWRDGQLGRGAVAGAHRAGDRTGRHGRLQRPAPEHRPLRQVHPWVERLPADRHDRWRRRGQSECSDPHGGRREVGGRIPRRHLALRRPRPDRPRPQPRDA